MIHPCPTTLATANRRRGRQRAKMAIVKVGDRGVRMKVKIERKLGCRADGEVVMVRKQPKSPVSEPDIDVV